MKGILKNTPAGWYVWYSVMRDEITSGYDSIPVYQETFDFNGKQPIIPLVEGKKVEFRIEDFWETGGDEGIKLAKLIIPKEEPKDVVLGYKTSLDAQMLDSKLPKQENCCTPEGQIKRYVDCIGCDRKPKQVTIPFEPFDKEKASFITKEGQKIIKELQSIMEQETLEEAMAANGYDFPASDDLWREGVQFGANWQEERMYSEEEVLELLLKSKIETSNLYYEDMKNWFEQNKKK